jgi:exodeoxyribonuclease VII large subunit
VNRRKVRYSLGGAEPPRPGPPRPEPPRPTAPAGRPPALPGGNRVFTVGELTRGIRAILESAFAQVAVRGEVIAVSRPPSGHLYFTLRDDGPGTRAQMSVVLWKEAALALRFRLEEGMRVVVCGRVTVYAERGSYQLIAERVDPEGPGAIAIAFERLKARLAAEGLFAPERKRPLPFLPGRIGLVTSLGGAALEDMLRSIYRRHPGAWVRIAPARVQGEGSAEEVAAALRCLERPESGVEVIILGRGGGSPEDLWTFNEEKLVRAVAASRVPTISAVGHEIDFTLCDFAADVRAQTPTHAGELVVPEVARLKLEIRSFSGRLAGALRGRVSLARERLDRLSGRPVLRRPEEVLRRRAQRLDELAPRLQKALYNSYLRGHDLYLNFSERLEALNPLSVLKRGYSVVYNSRGEVARGASDLSAGEAIRILLGEGEARGRIESAGESHGG